MTKRELAKLQNYRFAVASLARFRAKKVVVSELKEAGLRVTLIKPAEINRLAQEYLTQHRDRLIAEAEQTIATSPYFVKYRKPEAPEFMEK